MCKWRIYLFVTAYKMYMEFEVTLISFIAVAAVPGLLRGQ
jgi:hypothetical protein